MRDRFVHHVCNFLLNHVATEWYRIRIDLILDLGLQEYAKLFEEPDDA